MSRNSYSNTNSYSAMKTQFFMLLLGAFLLTNLFTACQPSAPVEPPINTGSPDVGIPEPLGDSLQSNWMAAAKSTIAEDFYIKGDSAKVISFQIKRESINDLLADIDELDSTSLRLQIDMALAEVNPAEFQEQKRSNFRPLLELAGSTNLSITVDTVFEFSNIDMHILHYLDSLNSFLEPLPEDIVSTMIPVSPDTVKLLIEKWVNTPKEKISSKIYEEDAPVQNDSTKLRYYTFNQSDTKKIIEHLKANPEDYFYIHLGVLLETDNIPMCTIIHLDDPARFESMTFDIESPPFFEFATPCPRACGNEY